MPSLIENPHFVTFLLSHRDLAPGFPPQKCCSSGGFWTYVGNFNVKPKKIGISCHSD
ncbi:hypothetical protein JHK82_042244 [Glycine max]|nr:hypothetical protein JHK87_042199 [Glycine soja]KAG5105274.1 hypothetical protein JHK82_042244 [Glycine max]KAG5116397.1 hypothetical protein JHK84_042510 [Glycine max]